MELNQTSKPRNETIRIKFNNIFLENILKKNSREIRATLSVVDTLFKIRGVPKVRSDSEKFGRVRARSRYLVRSRPNLPDSLPFSRSLPMLPEIFRPAAKFKRSTPHNLLSSGIIIKIWPTR